MADSVYWEFGDMSPRPPVPRPGDLFLAKALVITKEGTRRVGQYTYNYMSAKMLKKEIASFSKFWNVPEDDIYIYDGYGPTRIFSAWVPMTKNDIVRFEEDKKIIDARKEKAKIKRQENAALKEAKDYEEKIKTFNRLKSELGL